MDATNRRTKWHNAFIYAFVTTIMVLAAASLLGAVVGRGEDRIRERIDRTAQIALVEAQETRGLLCAILIQSENKDVRDAVRVHCDTLPTPEEPS